MPGLDPYHITDKLDDSLLEVIVTRLEARGKHPFFEGMLQDYLDAMGHMNVAWYLHLFSQATRGVFQWIGFDFA